MVGNAIGLVLLMLTAGAATALIARHWRWTFTRDPALTTIGIAVVFVSWCELSAVIPAFGALITDVPMAQMPVFASVSLVGTALLWWTLRRRSAARATGAHGQSPRGQTPWLRRPGKVLWLCAVPVSLLHIGLFISNALSPPGSYDGCFYHLPNVLRWLQNGILDMDVGVLHACVSGNADLWLMFFASLWYEPLFELTFVPLGILLGVSVAAISRELGASRNGCLISGLLALASPMIACQMYGSKGDVFGVAFLLTGVWAVLRLWRRPNDDPTTPVFVGGLSIGLAVGSKLSFMLWAFPVVLATLATFVWRAMHIGRWSEARRLLAVFVLAGLAPSCFWFARATVETGWPLYPVKVPFMGDEVGNGVSIEGAASVPHSGLTSLAYPWFEWKLGGYNYTEGNGIGPQVAAFAAVALVWLVLTLRRSWRSAYGVPRVLLLAYLVFGLTAYITILQSHPRWALPVWMVALAATGPLLGLLTRYGGRASTALLVLTITLSAVMTGLWPAKELMGRLRDGDLSRNYVYQLPDLIDELPPGTVVLNATLQDCLHYPLLGRAWQNKVVTPEQATRDNLIAPITREALAATPVDIVFTRGDAPPPFAPDVEWTLVFDDRDDPERRPSTAPTLIYRPLTTHAAGVPPALDRTADASASVESDSSRTP